MKILLPLLFLISFAAFAQSPELVIPGGHGEFVRGLAIHPNGTLVASSAGPEIKIWRAADGKLLKTIVLSGASSFSSYIDNLAFSNDGRYLAGTSGSHLHLIGTDALKVIRSIKLAPEKYESGFKVGALAAHPTQNAIYYAVRKANQVRLMRYDLGKSQTSEAANFPYPGTNPKPAGSISWSPNGNLAVVSFLASNDAAIINLEKRTGSPYPGGLAYLPDGNLLLHQRIDGRLLILAARPDGSKVWEKNIFDASLKQNGYYYNNLVIDNKSGRFYYGIDKGGMVAGDFRTGTDVALIQKPGKANGTAMALAPNGSLIVTSRTPINIAETNGVTGLVFREYGAPLTAVSGMVTDPNSHNFSLVSKNGQVRLIELTTRGPRFKTNATFNKSIWSAISNGGRYQAVVDKNNKAAWFDGKRKVDITLPFTNPRGLGVGPEGAMVAISAGGTAYYAPGTPTPRWTAPGQNHPVAAAYDYDVAFSPDGKSVLVIDYAKRGTDDVWITILYNAADGRERWRREGKFDTPQFSPDGRSIIGSGFNNQIIRLNANNGKEIKALTRTDGDHFRATFNASGTLMTGLEKPNKQTNDETITVVNTETGRISQRLSGHKRSLNRRGFLAGDFVLSAGFDNTIRLWDALNGKELGKLFIFDDTEDWVVLAPDGRFDATPGAMSMLYYTVGRQVIQLEQLYENFYSPGLLGQLLERSPNPTINTPVSIGTVKPPPTVTLAFQQGTRNLIVEDDTADEQIEAQTRDAKIVVRAVAPESKVAEMRLYHNGKLLGNFRGLGVEDDPTRENERTYPVTLLPGENAFRAVALNAERTESAPALLSVRYTAPASAPSTPKSEGITLHLMTIGINVYKNPRYNLNYAEADAGGIEKAIKTGLAGIVSTTKTYSIRNNGASRTDILGAIQKVKEQADANDVFIFYYAGHGVMSEGTTKDFFLVPYDVTQLYGNDEGLAAKGISATELKTYAAAIPAQKQLYILDACQSAGAVQSIAMRGAAEEKAIAQLARSTGTHWLTASGSEQFASEFDQLGHGAFTYVLLQALSGKAAGNDTRITVNELKAYLDRVVPEITEKYNGQAQYPASYGFGQDFPVGVKR